MSQCHEIQGHKFYCHNSHRHYAGVRHHELLKCCSGLGSAGCSAGCGTMAHSHCHVRFPEVVKTTTTYRVPAPVMVCKTTTRLMGLCTPAPVTNTTVPRSSVVQLPPLVTSTDRRSSVCSSACPLEASSVTSVQKRSICASPAPCATSSVRRSSCAGLGYASPVIVEPRSPVMRSNVNNSVTFLSDEIASTCDSSWVIPSRGESCCGSICF